MIFKALSKETVKLLKQHKKKAESSVDVKKPWSTI